MSGVPVEPVYGPDDGEHPGQYPYTRGPYASMYRSKLWTMRMFAGFGTALDTNRRFHELLDAGSDGLSTAFDLPTLMGRDSDDELALGEVGKCGVAVDTLADVEDLYRGIDLGAVTTSMTINGPAAVIFAMFVANAEATGVERARLGGTLQNDILKEYQAQKEFIFPPRPSLRLVADTIAFCAAEMPRWHPISISGYHIREAGSTAAQELAFTRRERVRLRRARVAGRTRRRRVRARLSFFFNAHIDFFDDAILGPERKVERLMHEDPTRLMGQPEDPRGPDGHRPHGNTPAPARRLPGRGDRRPGRGRGRDCRRRRRRQLGPHHQLGIDPYDHERARRTYPKHRDDDRADDDGTDGNPDDEPRKPPSTEPTTTPEEEPQEEGGSGGLEAP